MSYIPRRIPERGRMHRLGFFRSSSFNSFNGLILITLHVVRPLFIAFFKGVLHYVRANNILNTRFNHSQNLQLVICNIMIKKVDKNLFLFVVLETKTGDFHRQVYNTIRKEKLLSNQDYCKHIVSNANHSLCDNRLRVL